MDNDLLSVGEVALMLRVSEKSVYRNVKTIPGAFKLFGVWRFDREILQAWLKRQAAPKSEATPLPTGNRHGL